MVLQARAVSTDGLKPSFYIINVVVYAVQVKILVYVLLLFYLMRSWMLHTVRFIFD